MPNQRETDGYLNTLEGEAREWMEFFVRYMQNRHPELEEAISFQMPTYRLGSGKQRNYIAFSTAKNHFSLHTMDFDYIVLLKGLLSKPGKGKGCVNVPYGNRDERAILTEAIEEILRRREENSAPAVRQD